MYRIGVVCAMGVFVCHMNDIWYVWCAKWIIETNTFEHVYTNSLTSYHAIPPTNSTSSQAAAKAKAEEKAAERAAKEKVC